MSLKMVTSRLDTADPSPEQMRLAVDFVRELVRRDPSPVEVRAAELFLARLARLRAEELGQDAQALRAQSAQVLRLIAAARASHTERDLHQETNVEFAARLFAALRHGGSARLAELPPDAEDWHRLDPDGRLVISHEALCELWSRPEISRAVATMFHGHGDHVIVRAENRWPGRPGTPLWLLLRFEGPALLASEAFEDRVALNHSLVREASAANGG